MSNKLKIVETKRFEVLGLPSEKDYIHSDKPQEITITTSATTAASTSSTMTNTKEEIAARITELGDIIKAAKAEKKPKEEWEPALQEMLSLKVR